MISYGDCLKVVEQNDAFIHRVEEVDGLKFHIFDYKLANYEDFKTDVHKEMRGVTFLWNHPFKRNWYCFPHLKKFFNLDQGGDNEQWKLAKIPIQTVQTKEDGSMVVPILVNGKIYCKTRKTFESHQAQVANRIIANKPNLEKMIKTFYSEGFIPIFEFCGPWNQIVLPYQQDELILLQVRNLETGEYLPFRDMKIVARCYNLKVAEQHSLEGFQKYIGYWKSQGENLVDVEGWVIRFDNDHFVKVKTEWYRALHHILTEGLTRENEMIGWVLDEKLDDVLAQVDKKDPRRKYALDIAKFMRTFMNEAVKEVENIIFELDPNRPNSRKKFAIANKEHRWFGVLMQCFTEHEDRAYNPEKIFDKIKQTVLKRTYRWGMSQEFLTDNGFVIQRLQYLEE